jgi:hypothetical protein
LVSELRLVSRVLDSSRPCYRYRPFSLFLLEVSDGEICFPFHDKTLNLVLAHNVSQPRNGTLNAFAFLAEMSVPLNEFNLIERVLA